MDTDLEAKGYWLRPVARAEEARIRLLRKQVLIGVISILEQASRVGPSLNLGIGQGGLLVALASMPLLVEQACRYRVVAPDEMGRYRATWSKVVGLVSVDPDVVRQRSDLEMLKKALPEISKVQPRGLYREVIVTASCYEPRFARDVGGLVAAPAGQGLREGALRRALCVPPPAYVEDSEVGPGLCCACGKG